MIWIKYLYHTVAQDAGKEVDVFTPMAVPNTEEGYAVASREAYNGEIETFEESQEVTADE